MLNTFKEFIADENAWEMYISGQAGTGKTTGLKEIINYCKDNGINALTCAFTHKACDILRDKIPNADVTTLHSFLKKRPWVNDNATRIEHVDARLKHGESEKYDVILIDEYSMIGESDYKDLGLMQDPNAEGKPLTKVVYIGDLNQLPPVDDTPAIYPAGKYNVNLTKVYRQEGNSDLLDILCKLVDYINGKTPEPLLSNNKFKRGRDIVKEYKNSKDAVLLAYTNKRVEELNAQIEGRAFLLEEDKIFSPTSKEYYTFKNFVHSDEVDHIINSFGKKLKFGSKYKTLEHLVNMSDICFAELEDEDGNINTYSICMGHYQYKLNIEKLTKEAVDANKAIEDKYKLNPKAWASANPSNPLARKRANAWRNYMTYKDNTLCVDFTHAMTVHKSQGSTFNTVIVDTEDLGICSRINYQLYLKLMYVAFSRASNLIITN